MYITTILDASNRIDMTLVTKGNEWIGSNWVDIL